MAEQTLGDRDERLAANFDATEFTECFPTSEGVSFRSRLGKVSGLDCLSRTVSGATTVAQTDHLGVINVTAESATITWPSGLAIGTRVQVRKIGADEAQSVDVAGAGGVVFTASQETEIPIFGNGGNWIFEQVTATRVELVGGWDAGSNSNGQWCRYADKSQVCRKIHTAPSVGDGASSVDVTVPKLFVAGELVGSLDWGDGTSGLSENLTEYKNVSVRLQTNRWTLGASPAISVELSYALSGIGRWLPLS